MKTMVPLALALLSAMAHGQAPGTTVLGIELGQPLRTKACASDVAHPKKGLCATVRQAVAKRGYTGSTELLFYWNSVPSWVGTVKAQLIDGNVEMLLITTDGDAQALVYRDLHVKFGNPVSRNFDATQGGIGGRRLEAGWLNGPVRIDFVGVVDGRDYGYVQIGTPQGIAAWRDGAAKSAPQRRGL